ncbi:MAG: glycoside hydrolase family 27 protein [Lachnospiraceae bacterium]|nr:glycoside hydrolase family 27 protein [Lachnospiraceae bacterium]
MDENLFAKTPPMGWNSYDYYDTTVNEEQVKANADYMAKNLKKYGWEYIVVDIEWYAHEAGSQRDKFQYIPFSKLEMDEYSRLMPDPERFPSSKDGVGFALLAEYIHGLGLKFGIHIMRGVPRIAAHLHTPIKGSEATANQIADAASICPWNPDMYGVVDSADGQAYYDSLLELYASWGVDFIKCDDICRYDQPSAKKEIEMIAKAIKKCGRPIVFSLSPGPAIIEEAWYYEKHANMWRITDDFWDEFRLLKDMFRRCEIWQEHVKEGCYPDCDMLPVGMLGKGFGKEHKTYFTESEQRIMMTLWCLFGSPLMIGGELTMLDDFTVELLTNEKVLAMLGSDCKPCQIVRDDKKAIWMAENKNTKEKYVALFNLGDDKQKIEVSLEELNVEKGEVSLEELWSGEKKLQKNKIMSEVDCHDCKVYLLK